LSILALLQNPTTLYNTGLDNLSAEALHFLQFRLPSRQYGISLFSSQGVHFKVKDPIDGNATERCQKTPPQATTKPFEKEIRYAKQCHPGTLRQDQEQSAEQTAPKTGTLRTIDQLVGPLNE
jgi:hypothetical protein